MKENPELLQALQMRVSKLEAQARRWRALCISAVLAGVVMVLVGASRPDDAVIRVKAVEAQAFLLKDDHGRVRARLITFPNDKHRYSAQVSGQPVLQFFDENGESVWVEPKQPIK